MGTAHATIRTTDGRASLTAIVGPGEATVSDGRGGCVEVARPMQVAVTEWVGTSLLKASVPMVLDAGGASISSLLDDLEAVAPPGADTAPPPVKVTGVVQIDAATTWIVNAVTTSEWVRKAATGTPVHCQVVLELLEWRQAEVVIRSPRRRSKKRDGRSTAPSARESWTVRDADTLAGIAAQVYGDYRRLTDIMAANNVTDPNRLVVGATLRLPQ